MMAIFDSPVRDHMSSPVASVHPDASVAAAQALLRQHRISSLAVIDGAGRPLGVVSRTDLLRLGSLRPQDGGETLLILPDVPVSWAMGTQLITVEAAAAIRDAAHRLVEHRVHRVLVVEDQLLVGILTTNDLARVVAAAASETPASVYMSSPARTIDALEPLSGGIARLAEDRVTGLVVIEDGKPAGLFSQLEALQAKDLPPDTLVGDVMGRSFSCLPADTPLHRVARSLAETRVRRVLLVEGTRIAGILTGIDLARAIAEEGAPPASGE